MNHSAYKHVKQQESHVSMFETYRSSSFPAFIFYDISFFSGAWMSELLQSSSVITETWNICCLSTEDWCKHLNTKGPPAAPVLRQLTNISCQSETRPSDRRRSHNAFFFLLLLEELSDDWKQRREQTKSLCNCSNCASAPATILENKWCFKMLFFVLSLWKTGTRILGLTHGNVCLLSFCPQDSPFSSWNKRSSGETSTPPQKIYLWWESTFFSSGWLTWANNFYTKQTQFNIEHNPALEFHPSTLEVCWITLPLAVFVRLCVWLGAGAASCYQSVCTFTFALPCARKCVHHSIVVMRTVPKGW